MSRIYRSGAKALTGEPVGRFPFLWQMIRSSRIPFKHSG